MFNYFHKNKFNYEKGQLAPVFIIVLVILLIMIFFTVNLGKVMLTKTGAANGSDAGAIAGGAALANTFNRIAVKNKEMLENGYEQFRIEYLLQFVFTQVAVSKGTAAIAKAKAAANQAAQTACSDPCNQALPKAKEAVQAAQLADRPVQDAAKGGLKMFWTVLGFYIGQMYAFKIIRDKVAINGRNGAIRVAHRYNFNNSGVGSFLKPGKPPVDMPNTDLRFNNYSDSLDKFMRRALDGPKGDPAPKEAGLALVTEHVYAWQDGELRDHSVASRVEVDPVDRFKTQVTFLPFIIEAALDLESASHGFAAHALVKQAAKVFQGALKTLQEACMCFNMMQKGPDAATRARGKACLEKACNAAKKQIKEGTELLTKASKELEDIPDSLAIAVAGIVAQREETLSDAGMEIICYIEDMYDGFRWTIRVDCNHRHGGKDYPPLWNAQYPNVLSYAIDNFHGAGAIHYNPRFGSDIVETDDPNK